MRKKRGKLKFTRNVLCHHQRKLFSPAILWKRKRRIQFILASAISQVSQFECRKADLQQQQKKKMQTESIYVQRRERVGELIWHRRPVTSIKENPAVDGHVQNDQQADADGFFSPPPLERPYAIVVVFAEHSTALWREKGIKKKSTSGEKDSKHWMEGSRRRCERNRGERGNVASPPALSAQHLPTSCYSVRQPVSVCWSVESRRCLIVVCVFEKHSNSRAQVHHAGSDSWPNSFHLWLYGIYPSSKRHQRRQNFRSTSVETRPVIWLTRR